MVQVAKILALITCGSIGSLLAEPDTVMYLYSPVLWNNFSHVRGKDSGYPAKVIETQTNLQMSRQWCPWKRNSRERNQSLGTVIMKDLAGEEYEWSIICQYAKCEDTSPSSDIRSYYPRQPKDYMIICSSRTEV